MTVHLTVQDTDGVSARRHEPGVYMSAESEILASKPTDRVRPPSVWWTP
jgi:hypothetical protein